MRYTWPLLVALAMFVAACGGTTEPAQETLPTLAATVDEIPTQETSDSEAGPSEGEDLNLGEGAAGLFTAEVAGATELTIAGIGAYTCEENRNVLRSASGDDEVLFVLPPNIIPGEYTVGTGDDLIASELTIGAVTYADNVFGVMTIDLVPNEAGDPVSGSFDMNYSAGDQSVNVVGTFNLTAASACDAG